MTAPPPDRPLTMITGASSGLGAALSDVLARAGHDLVLVARRAEKLAEVASAAQAHGAAAQVVVADLSTPDGLDSVVERVRLGDLDVLVSNAGIGGHAPFVDLSPGELDALWRLDATAPLALARAALPTMIERGHGSVVTVASLLAFSAGPAAPPAPARTVYCAAKAATVAFTRRLGAETADRGISTTVVCPGRIATDWSGGANRDHPDAMSAPDVAKAVAVALHRRDPVCVPGLAAPAAGAALERAELDLYTLGNRAAPAPDCAATPVRPS